MKYRQLVLGKIMRWGRSPCGERGLKSLVELERRRKLLSLPVRGAWVEMLLCACVCLVIASLPVRGAWVEIPCTGWSWIPSRVAPRAGSVG